MTSQYRYIVHCDEQVTGACAGFVEYAATDRINLARQSDRFTSESGWLRGYRRKTTWDVCPACRPAVEQRMAQSIAQNQEAPTDG